jgi:mannose-6-phosphate isomerase-like protein (cupin superfamily)
MRKNIALLALVGVATLGAVQNRALLNAIKHEDFKSITTHIAKSPEDFKTEESLKAIVKELHNKNYKVRAAAVWALAELSRESKLPSFVYEAWSKAANEPGYKYLSEPFFADTCKTTIYQLGIHNTDKGRMGMSHAIQPAGGVSNTLRRTTMSEEFFIVDGQGEFWLKNTDGSIQQFKVEAGSHFWNPNGQHIQFRNTGKTDLKMLVTTLPPFDDVIRCNHFEEDLAREIVFMNDGPWK